MNFPIISNITYIFYVKMFLYLPFIHYCCLALLTVCNAMALSSGIVCRMSDMSQEQLGAFTVTCTQSPSENLIKWKLYVIAWWILVFPLAENVHFSFQIIIPNGLVFQFYNWTFIILDFHFCNFIFSYWMREFSG